MHFRVRPTSAETLALLRKLGELHKLLNLSEPCLLLGTMGIQPLSALGPSIPQKVTAQLLTHSWHLVNVCFLSLLIT